MKDVPYIAHEAEVARLERVIKRLFILCIVSICFLVATNAYWIWYENQFIDEVTDTQEITQDLDSESGDAIINDGVHINGENTTDGKTNNHTQKTQENRR